MSEIIEDFMNPPEEYVPSKDDIEMILCIKDIVIKEGSNAIIKAKGGKLAVLSDKPRERFVAKEKFAW